MCDDAACVVKVQLCPPNIYLNFLFWQYFIITWYLHFNGILISCFFFTDLMLINVGYDLLGIQHGHQNPITAFVPATLRIHQTTKKEYLAGTTSCQMKLVQPHKHPTIPPRQLTGNRQTRWYVK